MYHYYPMHEYGCFGWGEGLIGLFLLAAFIALGVVLVRHLWGGGKGGTQGNEQASDSLHILRERYAKGELTTDEYEERKKVLSE